MQWPLDWDTSASEKSPERKYQTMFGGIAVYTNPSLSPGTVEFRNLDGEVIGRIVNVKQVDVRG